MRIVVVGEGMLELSCAASGGASNWRLGHGGDTLNSAIHLARFGADVAYATALGDDPFSDRLRTAWAEEGLDVSLVLTDPDRRPGLYAITTDRAGERSFTYWRNDSAARRLFASPDIARVAAAVAKADILLFSLISLAVLPPEGRTALFDLCRSLRARGGRIAFDSNYRPRLWANQEEARRAHAEALALTDIGLPTLEDETALHGARDAVVVAGQWRAAGVRDVVVKLGGAGCLVDGEIVPAPAKLMPLDTSGAGDAFDAGYLYARLAGRTPRDAALVGHRLAGWVVMQVGAIPPVSPMFSYADLA
jgi:2-dehydro-3-deoxygluconokinase